MPRLRPRREPPCSRGEIWSSGLLLLLFFSRPEPAYRIDWTTDSRLGEPEEPAHAALDAGREHEHHHDQDHAVSDDRDVRAGIRREPVAAREVGQEAGHQDKHARLP